MKRGVFWLVWGVALVPVLAALMSYATGIGVPEQRVNRGALMVPGGVLDTWQIQEHSGQRWRHLGRWQLLLVTSQACEAACATWLDTMPGLHRALGRDQSRVHWHLVSSRTDRGGLVSKQLTGVRAGVWVADPNGNLVLFYPFTQPPQDLFRDLRKVLKASRIG